MGSCLSLCFKTNSSASSNTTNQDEVHNVTIYCKAGSIGKHITLSNEACNEAHSIAISGTGVFLGSFPLDCDTGYWEIQLGQNPSGIRIGVKRYNPKEPVSLEKPLEDRAWCI